MRRREFIVLVGGAAAWAFAARAQQFDRVRKIGVLTAYSEHDSEPKSWVPAFQQRLHSLGWIERHNVDIEYRFAGTDPERIRAHAAEMVQATPDVILAHSPPVVRALQQITSTIPIVFVQVVDPVELGFVASLARPHGNITGFTNFEFSIGGKWVEALKEIAPTAKRALVVLEPNNPAASGFLRAIETVASQSEMQLILAGVQDTTGIERAMEAFAREPNGGLIVLPSPITLANRPRVIELAAAYGLPAGSGEMTCMAACGSSRHNSLQRRSRVSRATMRRDRIEPIWPASVS